MDAARGVGVAIKGIGLAETIARFAEHWYPKVVDRVVELGPVEHAAVARKPETLSFVVPYAAQWRPVR